MFEEIEKHLIQLEMLVRARIRYDETRGVSDREMNDMFHMVLTIQKDLCFIIKESE